MNEYSDEILTGLLIKKAVHGLTEAEEKQLKDLEAGRPRDESFELTASAISLVDAEPEPMPANLRSRIIADAERFFDSRDEAAKPVSMPSAKEQTTRMPFWAWLGWAVAAAAVVALAANVWMTRAPSDEKARTEVPLPTPSKALDPADARQKLIETAGDIDRASWSAGNVKKIAGVSGDIVWSDEKQAGYMRFKGLPANDPGKETYQLWIFDETQDKKTPIDGGTFDVAENGEVVIPINAKLKAKNPTMFAVTIEKPGGVVVSKQGKVAAIAKVET